MPTTSEQRSAHELCGARKKNGETCRNYAGLGTNHLGAGNCKFHLGNSPNQKRAAAKIVAERERERLISRAVNFGEIHKINPLDALMWTIYLSASHMEYLRQELSLYELPAKKGGHAANERGGFRHQTILRLWNEERDRLARTAKLALDTGVAERAIRIAETMGEQLAVLIKGILHDPELALTRKQYEIVSGVVKRHLIALDAPKDT
jgi:hypothetical protein